ncbi:DUF6992 family protein [Fibrisoma montanum]|uniref:DUF6992 family protein n=1 Tax=Fibrisoma montanum TaxID=2305895 RepID=UPI0011C2295C|nr:hypothetical protein [Fibrisoma montanum]
MQTHHDQLICWLLATPAVGRATPDPLPPTRSHAPGLRSTGLAQLRRHQLIHAWVFGGWAIANVVVGGTGMFFTDGYWHHFHHMNAAWGSINLIVAGAFLYQVRQLRATASRPVLTQTERQFRRFLRINLGLDLLYIAVGYWLNQQGAGSLTHQAMLQGFGQAIMLQGVTLLSVDLLSLTIWLKRRARLQRT